MDQRRTMRIIANTVLIFALLAAIVSWFFSGLAQGVQDTSNLSAQRNENLSLIIIGLLAVILAAVNILLRKRSN